MANRQIYFSGGFRAMMKFIGHRLGVLTFRFMGGVAPENASAALKSLARCPTLLRFLPCICICRNKILLINELSGRPSGRLNGGW